MTDTGTAAPPPAATADAASSRTTALVLLALLGILFLVELPGTRLFEPDETRYAEIAREMVASGDWTTPRLNGAHYWEKPPLVYWMEAASLQAFGISPWTARLPARLTGLGVLALLLLGTGGRESREERLWSGVIWMAAPLAFALGRINILDGPLSFFVTASFLAMRGFLRAHGEGRRAHGWAALAGTAAAGALLTKGLVALVLPGGALFLWALVTGRWKAVFSVFLTPALPLFLLLSTPYFVLVERASPGFNHHFWWVEHVVRFTTDEAKRPGPLWYFLPLVVVGMVPWTAWIVHAFRPAGPWGKRASWRADPDRTFLVCWFLFILLFFSVSKSKLAPYILPAVPALCLLLARPVATLAGGPRTFRIGGISWMVLGALMVAASFVGVVKDLRLGPHAALFGVLLVAPGLVAVRLAGRDPRRARTALAAGSIVLAAAVLAMLPTLSLHRSADAIAARMKEEAHLLPAQFRCHANSIPLAVGRPVLTVSHTDEMGTDDVYPEEFFCRARDFWPRWDAGEPMAVMVRRKDVIQFIAEERAVPFRVLMEEGEYVLGTNTPEKTPR